MPRPPGTHPTSDAVALDGCAIHRPVHLPGVEVVVAAPRVRSFPARLSEGLGVCLKFGAAHEVAVDGRVARYPADAVSVRTPGCLWASTAGHSGFVSVDVPPERLPPDWRGVPMGFVAPGAVPDVVAAAARLTAAESALQAEVALGEFLGGVLASDVACSDAVRADDGAAGAVAAACEYLRAHAGGRPDLDAVAEAAGLSKYALLRRFRRALGTTPHAYLVLVRVNRAQALLAAGSTPVDAAIVAGFSDQAHLGRWFRRLVGITPAAYRRQVRAAIAFQTAGFTDEIMVRDDRIPARRP